MKIILFISVFWIFLQHYTLSQEKLFSIDNVNYYTEQLISILKKNKKSEIKSINDVTVDDFNKYLSFCMKILDGKKRKVYESPNFIKEFERTKKAILKNYIAANYIAPTEIDKHYNRSLLLLDYQEIAISPVNEITKRKIEEIKEHLSKGENFTHLILKFGNLSLHKTNGITKNYKIFRKESTFEKVIYNLAESEISNPIKSSKSYHIVKLLKIKPNPGKIRVAHILIKKDRNPNNGKYKIDSIYDAVTATNASFGKIASVASEDSRSAKYGGILPWFGKGDFIPEIEDVAFRLSKTGDISEIIETKLGWHILQLIAYNPEYFSKNDIRYILAEKFLKNPERQKRATNFKENRNFTPNSLFYYSSKDFDKVIFSVKDRSFTIKDFHQFNLKNKFRGGTIAYKQFVKKTLYDFLVQSIVEKVPDLENKIKEAYESHIYFFIQNNKIWKNIFFQSEQYFNKNIAYYQKKYNKDITHKEIIKEVRDDYADAINKEWLDEIKTKYEVKIYHNKFKNNNILLNE